MALVRQLRLGFRPSVRLSPELLPTVFDALRNLIQNLISRPYSYE